MIDADVIYRALHEVLSPDGAVDLNVALSQPPCAAIRLRPGEEPGRLPFAVTPVAWHPRAFRVPSARPGACLAYATGDYYIQDAASLLAVRLLDVQPEEWICDLCAAPGGKSTAILESLQTGWLLANEVVHSRLPPLQLNLARHGSTRFAVSRRDPAELAGQLSGIFDAVLVDAPCSGQSLVSRGKQSMSAFQSRSIQHCALRQSRILDAAAPLVRPGGRLVYSTCTFAIEENEEQVEGFLERWPGWTLEGMSDLQSWESTRHENTYRLWPHRDGAGGAFAARLRRTDSEELPRASRRRHAPELEVTEIPSRCSEWAEIGSLPETLVQRAGKTNSLELRSNSQQLFAWPEPLPFTSVAMAGPELCFRKGSTWFPSYAAAMRRDGAVIPCQTHDLSEQQALRYVQGEMVPCSERGWTVATFTGKPLGWLKADGRHGKNHLPKAARLVV